ncbi:MAG: 16S rRNA processing protein RimM [Tenericutes bacterium]|jgi:16S rRNA processing protein RimM|nr:ribosome maturation factor RimM [Bacilli bacterium]MDD3995626.1 ribosome maturation factor RimM [Bacilli bacterium]MDD4624310.1 ribosome maturation factor RimM [Bacilli bacterium]MDD4831545.1 ribosome maturation factor RimM [Bacilli bacterium]NLV90702.1 16S rRNA processing protein RimM [Mycoplasmatota bacterium]
MIYIGKYVNTHGLKGEIRILSNFSRKDLVFKKGNILIIENINFEINSYRVHKNYDMVTFKNISNINEIEYLKGKNVYIDNIDVDYLIEDLINYKVLLNNEEHFIKEIIENKKYKIIVLSNNVMIPLIDNFIENIDNDKKLIIVRDGVGI